MRRPAERGPRWRASAALLAVLLALAWRGTAAADLHGVAFAVIDGDTVLFRPDHHTRDSRSFLKIRLADIDAPEADQPHGEAATLALSGRVLQRRVRIETVAVDDYGRTVGRLWLGGSDVNADLVRQGHAWASGWRGRSRYGALQAEAQSGRRGLWQADAPIPPWQWRRARAGASAPSASR